MENVIAPRGTRTVTRRDLQVRSAIWYMYRRPESPAPREVEVWRSEHRNSNQRLIDCVDVSSPMHNPKPRKSDVVKSRLRFVLFGFLPGFGSISSILIEDGNHARDDEIGVVSPSYH